MPFFGDIALLNPKGTVALAERGLMLHAVEFMLIVTVPVIFLLFFFAYRYRATNTKAKYTPDWEHAKMDELIWWAIPFEIVLILGALTWTSTHALDPKAPLEGNPPLVVQVVALDWKWLFIYPEQGVATVNYVALPVGRPVKFEITADAPMNSFWLPKLGGQIYAMTGMVTVLNLQASEVGKYSGASANYSGPGFAKMKFTADVMSEEDFATWSAQAHASQRYLGAESYAMLAKPSVPDAPISFGAIDTSLFSSIVEKFMSPQEAAAPHTH